jgi:hypothetical protein
MQAGHLTDKKTFKNYNETADKLTNKQTSYQISRQANNRQDNRHAGKLSERKVSNRQLAGTDR